MFENFFDGTAPVAVLVIVGIGAVIAALMYGLDTDAGLLCSSCGIASVMMGGYVHYM